MRHASLLQWSPYSIGGLGLFDDIDPSAQALSEAPVVSLSAGETLEPSRSGEPLLIIPIQGTLVVSNGETTASFERGALVGVSEVLLGMASAASVRADTDAVLLLIDRTRLDRLVELPGVDAQACPTCGSKMVRRVAKRGGNAGQPFLGCSRYPACKTTCPL